MFRESISALKALSEKEGNAFFRIPTDVYPVIMMYSTIKMTRLLGAELLISETVIPSIISQVNNRILDILLYLEKNFGVLDEYDIHLENKNTKEIKDIQTQIVNFIYCDNSVQIGDKNRIDNSDFLVNSNEKDED